MGEAEGNTHGRCLHRPPSAQQVGLAVVLAADQQVSGGSTSTKVGRAIQLLQGSLL